MIPMIGLKRNKQISRYRLESNWQTWTAANAWAMVGEMGLPHDSDIL